MGRYVLGCGLALLSGCFAMPPPPQGVIAWRTAGRGRTVYYKNREALADGDLALQEAMLDRPAAAEEAVAWRTRRGQAWLAFGTALILGAATGFEFPSTQPFRDHPAATVFDAVTGVAALAALVAVPLLLVMSERHYRRALWLYNAPESAPP